MLVMLPGCIHGKYLYMHYKHVPVPTTMSVCEKYTLHYFCIMYVCSL